MRGVIMDWKWFILFALLAILGTVFVGLWHPASAYPYLQQGENVTQGETYDLSGVSGFGLYEGQFAYWSNGNYEGTKHDPTKVMSIEPRFIYAVYIDPAIWNLGNWYKYTGTEETSHENNFAFKVVRGNVTDKSNTTQKGNITVYVPPPKLVAVTTAPPTPTTAPPTTATTEPTPIPTAPTPTASPPFPKPGLPLSPTLAVDAVIIGIGIYIYYERDGI